MKKPNQMIVVRIGLSVAILASATAAGLNLIQVRHQLGAFRSALNQTKSDRDEAQKSLQAAEQNATKLSRTLQETETALQASKAEAAKETSLAGQLGNELALVTRELGEARSALTAWRTGPSAEDAAKVSPEVRNLKDDVAGVLEENKMLRHRMRKLQLIIDRPEFPTLPADLRCKVVAVDPKWNFVLVDAGDDQGMIARAELLVARNGRFVAKARVVRVEKNRCVANLIPGSQVGEIHEGDVLIPAYPES
jgi:hypothetical protein